jgi:catechol 2,3-dioxygenase-like lactoylglutathione lyase family enzyme
MKPRITLITLGVDDLEAAIRFYRDGLGLATRGIVGQEFDFGAVAFFELESGLRLALWPRRSLAHDTGIAEGARSATEFAIAHNVRTREEVDAVLEQARQAGARIVKEGTEAVWGGYSGYFQDPDGHLWEVAWNPAWVADLD